MYTQGRYEVVMAKAVDLASVADVVGGTWAPADPHYIHSVALIVTNTIGAAGVMKFDLRPTAGSDTGRTDGTVAELTIPDATAAGKKLYARCVPPFRVEPGQEVVAQVTDAAAASDTGNVVINVERVWEPEAGQTQSVAG